MHAWQKKLIQIFQQPDLRKNIFYIVFLLVVFRIAAHIPVPGVNPEALSSLFKNNQFFSLMDIFAGGGLSNLSIVMLGVGPYITASIIIQLLTIMVPRLEELQKEGAYGYQKINQWTRYLTVPLAAIQGYSMLALLNRSGQPILNNTSPLTIFLVVLSAIGGTVFLMWIGELISEKKLGNGVSLLILAGIVARIPGIIRETYLSYDPDKLFVLLGFIVVALVVIAGIIFITEGTRNIPVSYAKRIIGSKSYGNTSSHLPLRVNQAGVIPIIFAVSILLFPTMIANFLMNVPKPVIQDIAQKIITLSQNQLYHGIFYFILVIVFTFFYTFITFKPDQVAENIQKHGGFIPGIRPGQETKNYLYKITLRITVPGALFLGAIAILPLIMQYFTGTQSLTIGGTSLLIVVSVVIEIMNQVQAQMTIREYDKF